MARHSAIGTAAWEPAPPGSEGRTFTCHGRGGGETGLRVPARVAQRGAIEKPYSTQLRNGVSRVAHRESGGSIQCYWNRNSAVGHHPARRRAAPAGRRLGHPRHDPRAGGRGRALRAPGARAPCATRDSNSTYHSRGVLCMSWCHDFEFRVPSLNLKFEFRMMSLIS